MSEHIHREADIARWATDRNIFRGGTAETQSRKLLEEAHELEEAIREGDRDGIIDGIGDTIVCLVVQAQFAGLTLTECIEHAWQEIKDRKGQLINGVFIKEGDPHSDSWREAFGCSPAPEGTPPPEERIRKSRGDEPESEGER